jgi:drug/metabolite transporter (DMT)-like permease
METSNFWLSIVVVVLLGVTGSVVFKYGTVKLGSLSLHQLLEINFSSRFWFNVGLLVSGILLVFYGGWQLRDDVFAMRYLFTPIIFGALVLMFLSRFLLGIPLSSTGLARLTSITTSLLVMGTSTAGVIIFHEKLELRIILGILMSIIAVLLLSGE